MEGKGAVKRQGVVEWHGLHPWDRAPARAALAHARKEGARPGGDCSELGQVQEWTWKVQECWVAGEDDPRMWEGGTMFPENWRFAVGKRPSSSLCGASVGLLCWLQIGPVVGVREKGVSFPQL